MVDTQASVLDGFVDREKYCEQRGISLRTEFAERSHRKGPPFYLVNNRIFYKVEEVREWLETKKVLPIIR